jgi:hypothetical protein
MVHYPEEQDLKLFSPRQGQQKNQINLVNIILLYRITRFMQIYIKSINYIEIMDKKFTFNITS